MTEYFCDCFRKWNEEDGAWPKWVSVVGASSDGGLYIYCSEHNARWVK